MDNTINILYSTNNNGIKLLEVSLYTLIKNKNKESKYHIYIAHNNISLSNQKKLQTFCGHNNNVELTYVNCTKYEKEYGIEDVTKHGLDLQWPSPIFYWYLAPLFINADRIIYLDIDTYVCKDLTKFYNLKFSTLAAGIRDTYHIWKIEIRNEHGIEKLLDYKISTDYYKKYTNVKKGTYHNIINTGSFLLDLNQLKKINLHEIFATCNKQGIMDQDYINIYHYDKLTNIDIIYNFSLHLFAFYEKKVSQEISKYFNSFAMYELNEQSLQYKYNDAYVIHYSMRAKPNLIFNDLTLPIIKKIGGIDKYMNLIANVTSLETNINFAKLNFAQQDVVREVSFIWNNHIHIGFTNKLDFMTQSYNMWGKTWFAIHTVD